MCLDYWCLDWHVLPVWRQAIIWGQRWHFINSISGNTTSYSDIWIETQPVSYKKMYLNIPTISDDHSVSGSMFYQCVIWPSLVQIMACRLDDAKPISEPMLESCWWDPWEQNQRNFNSNWNIFIQENAFENIICEMASILSRPQCVNVLIVTWKW